MGMYTVQTDIPGASSKGTDAEAPLFSLSAYREHMQGQSPPTKTGSPSIESNRERLNCRHTEGAKSCLPRTPGAPGQRVRCGRHLSFVEGLVSGVAVVEEAHVDEGDEQTGRILRGDGIVRSPLVEDKQDQVAKKGAHEDNLGDEAQKDVQGLLEVPGGKPTTVPQFYTAVPRSTDVMRWRINRLLVIGK